MKLTGRVINGKIEIDDDAPLPEGASVEVMIDEAGEAYDLTEEEDEELWQAHLAIERGEFVTSDDVLARLRSQRARP
ncbi:MAG TPA: hypothetical protein VMT00_01030 [Thermoanaerobaculia bacterium]|nr:hypothetical protein [Thermoanaerobaculia bacterium]